MTAWNEKNHVAIGIELAGVPEEGIHGESREGMPEMQEEKETEID